jgi:hypothetical protein
MIDEGERATTFVDPADYTVANNRWTETRVFRAEQTA